MSRWPDPRPFLAVTLINSGDGIAGTLVPLYLDQSGYPVNAIGVLVAVAGVTSLLSRMPSGLLYRRRRARRLMYFALALQALGTALYALPVFAAGHFPAAGEPLVFGLIRGLHGFAVGMATTVNMALFMDTLPPGGNRHRHLAAYASALSLGYTVGGLGGGLLGEWLDYGPAFVCSAGFPLLAVFCITTPARGGERPVRPPAPTSLGERLQQFVAALRHPQVANVALVSFFLQVFHQLGQTYVPLYALSLQMSLSEIGLLRGTHSLANTLARPFGGEVTRWLGHNRVGVLGLALIGALLMLTPWQAGLVGLLLLFVGIGLGRAAVLVANTVAVADIPEGTVSRGVAVGLYNATRDLGGIVGPVLGGYIAAVVGLRQFFWVGPPLVFALFGFLFWATLRGAQPEKVPA
ncbi:MAG TPA: MFS transporter [Chloroflexota bacterium]|nr:MFS transporter [Chloroflexota bacterium]